MQTAVKKLDILCNEKIGLFFEYFGCDLIMRPNKLVGVCPIHGGDNRLAFNYYTSGHWKCRTHGCHNTYYSTPIGLIRGLLSKREGHEVNFSDTMKFIYKSLDTNFEDLQKITIEKPVYIKPNSSLNLDVGELRSRLQIPCPYYSRKFDKNIVEQQLIGYCDTGGRFFNKRSVVPILDRTGSKILACQGRSIHEECTVCHGYHAKGVCPSYYYPKWKTTKDFATDMTLYNYWQAKKAINSKKTLFVTESVGNVLRLMEFGIYNSVATFGTQFSEFQKEMVENSGAETIIYIRDAGQAGELIAKRVQESLGQKCIVPDLPIVDDVAKVVKQYFEGSILPILQEWI